MAGIAVTEVEARAPGKIILTGEHAVVHGSTAIAASIDLYTHVHVQLHPLDNENGCLLLKLKDVQLELSWPIKRIHAELSNLLDPFSLEVVRPCSELTESISVLVGEHEFPEAREGLAAGVSAFLWLFTSINGIRPATITVSSDLPLSSGLGSSASFCVALAAAFLALSGSMGLHCNSQSWLKFGESNLELVNKWAFEGEKIIHGKPSGIDNTVSTFGNVIMFRLGQQTRIKPSIPLRMLITNTKVRRNTKALVAAVSERASRHPDAMSAVFTAIDSISKEVSSTIQLPASDEVSVTEMEAKLEELMEMNQGLLQCLGVSHSSIEAVLQTTLKYKLVSKLTGAGGGGCVLTLLPTLLSRKVIDGVMAELESHGFECMMVAAGGGGLEVCFGRHS
ncbi:mevalonate kinase [Nymphaea colorata]|nr:mevalonate kinase [Nymphaea colorata]XP_031493625.1 mevalonate kinase [Nymphaea colorata]